MALKRRWWRTRPVRIACAAAAVLMGAWVTAAFLRFHQPGYGFTYVLDFGGTFGGTRLPEVAALPIYEHPGVAGYDAQSYAQAAVRPDPGDAELAAAIDSVPYRARRAAMAWAAWCAGLGRPWLVLNAYALINLVSWWVLAWLLTRWLRLDDPFDLLRWAGIVLSCGVLASLRHALTDGPALTCLAAVVWLHGSGRTWAAAGCGALAGLTRETALLGAGMVVAPSDPVSWRGWSRGALHGLAMAAPVAVWAGWVAWAAGGPLAGGAGVGNLATPFTGYAGRWSELAAVVRDTGWTGLALPHLATHVAITVQVAWVACVWRWSNPWWRIGAAHAALACVLGPAVWEGMPGASARALLPLLVAFNMLVPRRWWGVALAMAGNLGLVAGVLEMRPPALEPATVSGPAELAGFVRGNERVAIEFASGFFAAEQRGGHRWRWTWGEATVRIANPHPFAVRGRVRLGLRATSPRRVVLEAASRTVWAGEVGPDLVPVDLAEVVIPSGALELDVRPGPPGADAPGDQRKLGVAVYDVAVELLGPVVESRPFSD